MRNFRYNQYIINGDPTPLARPRFGKTGKMWDPQRQLKYKCRSILEEQHEGELFTGPLFLYCVFYMPIPAKYDTSTKKDYVKHTYHYYKPDLSNLVKFAEDICNNVVFTDDCIISSCFAEKVYSETPRTEINLLHVNLYDVRDVYKEKDGTEQKMAFRSIFDTKPLYK